MEDKVVEEASQTCQGISKMAELGEDPCWMILWRPEHDMRSASQRRSREEVEAGWW